MWWLSSQVVSVLDSGAEGPGFKSQSWRCRVTSLRQTVHCASVHQAAKLVAALLRVARVTAGLAESNGSLPPGLWLASPGGWLPRTGISSGTLRSVIEYGLPLLFTCSLHYSNVFTLSLTVKTHHWVSNEHNRLGPRRLWQWRVERQDSPKTRVSKFCNITQLLHLHTVYQTLTALGKTGGTTVTHT